MHRDGAVFVTACLECGEDVRPTDLAKILGHLAGAIQELIDNEPQCRELAQGQLDQARELLGGSGES